LSQQLGALQTHSFSFLTQRTYSKFRCNIFIGVRIIKEMPGSVASGTHCIISPWGWRFIVETCRRDDVCGLLMILYKLLVCMD